MTKSQTGNLQRVKQLKLPSHLIGQQRTRVDILAESQPCPNTLKSSPRTANRYKLQNE
jgi:hypothetical protein